VQRARNALGQDTTTDYTPNGDLTGFSSLAGTANPGANSVAYDLTGTDPTFNPQSITEPSGEKTTADYYPPSGTDPLQRYRACRRSRDDLLARDRQRLVLDAASVARPRPPPLELTAVLKCSGSCSRPFVPGMEAAFSEEAHRVGPDAAARSPRR
jgi:hypothetical protein